VVSIQLVIGEVVRFFAWNGFATIGTDPVSPRDVNYVRRDPLHVLLIKHSCSPYFRIVKAQMSGERPVVQISIRSGVVG